MIAISFPYTAVLGALCVVTHYSCDRQCEIEGSCEIKNEQRMNLACLGGKETYGFDFAL